MRVLAILAVLAASWPAYADRLVSGTVYVDADGDGDRSAGEPGVGGVWVVWETSRFSATDASGRFQLSAPEGDGMVWVRTPDGFQPAPVWADLEDTGDQQVALGLRPAAATGPLQFVHASDSHVGGYAEVDPSDLAGVLEQAVDLEPLPHFITLTGDLSQANMPDELLAVRDVTAGLAVPFVPVPGNHDWYDGGSAYRAFFGPPTYAFDAGGVHVIVLNDSATAEERAGFVVDDLARVGNPRPVVVLTHAPLTPDLVDLLEELGAAAVFAGHIHANRVLRHDALVEVITEPVTMGGIDQTPAGFRVIAIDADGTIAESHHTVVAAPRARIVHPTPASCRGGDLIASVAVGAARPEVRARIGDAAVDLTWQGGWTFTGPLPGGGGGQAQLEVISGDGTPLVSVHAVAAPACATDGLELADWPQLQGDPGHGGARARDLDPPLRVVWARAAGDHLLRGAPAVAGERLFVPLSDLGDGERGGLVALDARTGRELWRRRTGAGVRNTPAVAGDTVVVGALDGQLWALDAATGAVRWRYQLGGGLEPLVTAQYAAPAIAGGVVYAGVQREFVALDLATGEPRWSDVPSDLAGWFGSHAAPAVAEGAVIGSFARGGWGGFAWTADRGAPLWQTDPVATLGTDAPPLVAGGTVYLVNEVTEVTAIELASGITRWTRQLDPTAFEWGAHVAAPLALAGGVLYVPVQGGALHAIDAADGTPLWRADLGGGDIRPVHYRGQVGAASAPVVTGSTVWIGGADGRLRALDAATGELLWSIDLGAPVLAAPVPAGDLLFVATYDGVVRALAPDALVRGGGAASADLAAAPAGAGGCGCMSTGETTAAVGGGVLLLVLVILLLRRGRRFDGRPATGVPDYRRIIPFLMRGKNEAVVYFEARIDLGRTLPWIKEWNAAHAPLRITVFHLVLAALARTMHERPRLNRYVSGRRLWQRDGVYISFAAKKRFDDDAPLATVKRRFAPGEKFVDMVAALSGDVGMARSDKDRPIDKEVSTLLRLPSPLLRVLVRLTRALDQVNLAPAALLRDDPMYSSVFAANLGSIDLDAAYHHLYEWGNCPLFATLGKIEEVPTATGTRTVAVIKFSYDERIEDGLYAAHSLQKFRQWVEDPASWID